MSEEDMILEEQTEQEITVDEVLTNEEQTEYIHLVDTDFDCKDLRFRLIGNVVIVHTAIESSISLDVST